jgi:LmbE family N-acetylglucosaminyl deacetylase
MEKTMNVLAIGSHPDDIELGCAGTLLKHASSGDTVTMLIVSHGEVGPGNVAEREKEQLDSAKLIGADVVFGRLPDCEISLHELELVHLIERTIKNTKADIVYTHGILDTHQDHRAVALATLGASRHCSKILCYDAPSSYGFTPTVFTDITGHLENKIKALECHKSQVEASAMASPELVRTSAGYRGHQARVKAAEGFMPHRLVMVI